MTVVAIKTKTEQTLQSRFVASAKGSESREFEALRRRALQGFAATGLPSRRVEAYKYTDLRAKLTEALPPAVKPDSGLPAAALLKALGPELAALEAVTVIVHDGAFAGIAGGVAPERGVSIAGLVASGLTPSDAQLDDPAVALNLTYCSDGVVIKVAAQTKAKLPVHIVYVSGGEQPVSTTTRSRLEIATGASITVLESHVRLGKAALQSNHVTEVSVADGATLAHLKVSGEGSASAHLTSWLIDLGGKADYQAFQFTAEPGLVRNQGFVTYRGERTTATFNAVFLARDEGHVDTTLVIDHAVPKCISRETIRGVLDGKARGVFQGKVIVRPDAQKSDGKQMAKALMLSPTAEFDSKPELEIYADDVVCGHGSTVAELDDAQMFYLRARGIPEQQSRAMLVEAFVADVLETVGHDGIRQALQNVSSAWLRQDAAARS